MKKDCEFIIGYLELSRIENWAKDFVSFKETFWIKYCFIKPLEETNIFSTIHGIDFFQNVLDCLNGKEWEPGNKGEYEENFRKFIKYYRNE